MTTLSGADRAVIADGVIAARDAETLKLFSTAFDSRLAHLTQ